MLLTKFRIAKFLIKRLKDLRVKFETFSLFFDKEDVNKLVLLRENEIKNKKIVKVTLKIKKKNKNLKTKNKSKSDSVRLNFEKHSSFFKKKSLFFNVNFNVFDKTRKIGFIEKFNIIHSYLHIRDNFRILKLKKNIYNLDKKCLNNSTALEFTKVLSSKKFNKNFKFNKKKFELIAKKKQIKHDQIFTSYMSIIYHYIYALEKWTAIRFFDMFPFLQKKANEWLIYVKYNVFLNDRKFSSTDFSITTLKKFRVIFLKLNLKNFSKKKLVSSNKFFLKEPEIESNYFFKKNNLNSILSIFWNFFKNWIFPLFLCVSSFIFLLYTNNMPFFKLSFGWLVFFMLLYWLLSGFVFFCKKYQYNLWTTAIQRFWQRSLILFWILEVFLFSIFMYLTLNANAESFYMADNLQFYKNKLFSWRVFIYKLSFITLILILLNYFLVFVKSNTFNNNLVFISLLSFVYLYLFWLEFYQFFVTTTFYSNIYWVFFNKEKNNNEFYWVVESDEFKTRNVNNYVVLLIILKFWHVVFIVFFWLFFVVRSLESRSFKYGIISANIQNAIILYVFSWIFMYPWFKYFFRIFMDYPYKWFYVNNREVSFRILFYNVYYTYVNTMYYVCESLLRNFNYSNNSFVFFYENFSNNLVKGNGFRKDYVTNMVLQSIKNYN